MASLSILFYPFPLNLPLQKTNTYPEWENRFVYISQCYIFISEFQLKLWFLIRSEPKFHINKFCNITNITISEGVTFFIRNTRTTSNIQKNLFLSRIVWYYICLKNTDDINIIKSTKFVERGQHALWHIEVFV